MRSRPRGADDGAVIARSVPKTVYQYIAAQSASLRPRLRELQRTVRAVAGDAEEGISYGMPSYRTCGRPIVQFAVWKDHIGLYLDTKNVATAFARELRPYEVAKGVIRFPHSEPLPMSLIGSIVAQRALEAVQGSKQTKKR